MNPTAAIPITQDPHRSSNSACSARFATEPVIPAVAMATSFRPSRYEGRSDGGFISTTGEMQ
jgi:hypothetical protein